MEDGGMIDRQPEAERKEWVSEVVGESSLWRYQRVGWELDPSDIPVPAGTVRIRRRLMSAQLDKK